MKHEQQEPYYPSEKKNAREACRKSMALKRVSESDTEHSSQNEAS